MRYDVPLKELLHHFPQRFLQMLTGLQATDWLNVEYPSVKSRRPDLVARLKNCSILYLELQRYVVDFREFSQFKKFKFYLRTRGTTYEY